MKKWIKFYGVIFICLTLSFSAQAGTVTSIISFGDSISDNGTEDGYGAFRFSNGPVWVDYLADANHLNSSLVDRAISGATSSGVLNQVNTYLVGNTPTPETLFTVSVGGNDLATAENFDALPNTIANATANITTLLNNLVSAGARNLMISNLYIPPLNTPTVNETAAIMFNTALAASLADFETTFEAENSIDINVYGLDLYALYIEIITDPGSFGFSNVTDPAPLGGPYDGYLFYDLLHPTTAFHNVIAGKALDMVVPVPSAIWLLGSGLIGLVGIRRTFRKA